MITKTLAEAATRIEQMLANSDFDIEQAMRQNDGKLSIDIGVKLEAKPNNKNALAVSMNLVKSRLKVKEECMVDEQPGLFDSPARDLPGASRRRKPSEQAEAAAP